VYTSLTLCSVFVSDKLKNEPGFLDHISPPAAKFSARTASAASSGLIPF
jgi:hypothetical protein